MDKHAWLHDLTIVVNGLHCTANYARELLDQPKGTQPFRVATKSGVIIRPDKATLVTPNDHIDCDNRNPISLTNIDRSVERFYEVLGGSVPTLVSHVVDEPPTVKTEIHDNVLSIITTSAVRTVVSELIVLPDDDLQQFLCDQKGKNAAHILQLVRNAEAGLKEYLRWFKAKDSRPTQQMEGAL